MTETPMVPLIQITSAGNLRGSVGDVSELAASIAEIGLLEPLVVRSNGKGYELLAGHRRLEALKALKWKEVPVRILDTSASDGEVARLAIQLVENLQRVDLSPVEEASGYAQLKAFGWTQVQIAQRIGRSEAHVSKRLSLLDLPDRAIDLYAAGRIGTESLYELTKVVDAEADLSPILNQLAQIDIEDTAHPVEEVQALVRETLRDREANTELAARIAAYEESGVRILPAKYDDYGHVTLPKDKLDWNFDLDVDKHSKEPCHGVCLYIQYGSVRESHHCTDRRRHGPDGASKLKLKSGRAKSSVDDAERQRQSDHRELVKAMTEAEEAVMAGRAPARDTVLGRVASLYLGGLGSVARKKAIALLDLTAELSGDEYGALEKLYADADTANRHRILLAAVLANGHEASAGYHLYDDVRVPHLSFLAELGQPVDNPEIHPREDWR